jgi:type 1 glutamine amidotransferase
LVDVERRPRALVVRGGWEGHQPARSSEAVIPFLRSLDFDVTVSDSLGVYADTTVMGELDLVVQCWSNGVLAPDEQEGLIGAVAAGTGFAGWHGGVIATFRSSDAYHYLVGGQFVCHPGGFVDYDVDIVTHPGGHPVTRGLDSFSITTEQYWCHVDPGNDVLATTRFTGAHGAPETAGVSMPVVWTRRHQLGRVFISTLGHFPEELDLPPVRALTLRGLAWAAREGSIPDYDDVLDPGDQSTDP